MTMHEPISLAIVYGSTREGRLCDRLVAWVAGRIARSQGFTLDLIDPATLGLPSRHERRDGAAVTALKQRIGRADAFIVVTPEYNHGYPAALKHLIDSVSDEWQAKPVAIRDTVSFADAWRRFDAAGELLEPGRAEDSMTCLLAQLTWWARILRKARRDSPLGLMRA